MNQHNCFYPEKLTSQNKTKPLLGKWGGGGRKTKWIASIHMYKLFNTIITKIKTYLTVKALSDKNVFFALFYGTCTFSIDKTDINYRGIIKINEVKHLETKLC